jgi:hypothetical protein
VIPPENVPKLPETSRSRRVRGTWPVGPLINIQLTFSLCSLDQARQAPIQRLADKVVAPFVATIMSLSLVTFLFWSTAGAAVWPDALEQAAGDGADLGVLLVRDQSQGLNGNIHYRPANHRVSMGIFLTIRPITGPQWEYSSPSGQSQGLNRNIPQHCVCVCLVCVCAQTRR